MSIKPRKHISKITPCVHGGPDYKEAERSGIDLNTILDFSVNCNPLELPPSIKQAVNEADISTYPDSNSSELCRLIAKREGIEPEEVIFGSGSMEIIRLAVLAYFDEGDKVLICEPTFGEYEKACEISAVDIIKYKAKESDNYRFNTNDIIALAKQHKPKAIFLCNPNNPSGQYLEKSEIERLLKTCRETLILLDEAYIAFTEGKWDSCRLRANGNLLIIRSMTKDFALAGLRIGYAISSKQIIDNLSKVSPPWNVSATAQAAGVAALKEESFVDKSDEEIRKAKTYLMKEIASIGYKVIPTSTNFFLVNVGNAEAFRGRLLKTGIMVRDCTSFGLSEYVRISPRMMDDCKKLIKAIKEINYDK